MSEFDIVKEIFHKLESLDNNVDAINITLAKQEVSLTEHIKRSNLLEEQMEPIKAHVNRVNSLILLLGGLFACIGAIEGFLKILDLLR